MKMSLRRACGGVSVRDRLPIGRSGRWRAAQAGFALMVVLAACSAPSPDGLFSPVFVATRSGGNGGGLGETDLPPVGAAGNGEGQGGSELSFAGAGGSSGGTDVGSGSSGAAATDAGLPDAGAPPDAEPPCVAEAEVCDGLDNDCDGDADPGTTCPQLCAGFSVEERSYMFCSEEVQRGTALARCEAEGMRLVWLETPAESAAVREQISLSGLVPAGNGELLTQIGGSDADDNDEWFWVGNDVAPNGFEFWNGGPEANGGEAVDDAYADWSDGEPSSQQNEDCAAMIVLGGTRAPGQWDDRSCTEQVPFLCEIP